MKQLFRTASGGPGAYVAQVSYSGTGGFGALWDAEHRDIPLFAPGGVRYRPKEGDRVLLLPGEGQELCAGVLCAVSGLMPGELELTGPNGSHIYFRQNGDIVLNGVTITKQGEILPKGGAS